MKPRTKEAFKMIVLAGSAAELLHGVTHGTITTGPTSIAALFGVAACATCAIKAAQIALGEVPVPEAKKGKHGIKPGGSAPGF